MLLRVLLVLLSSLPVSPHPLCLTPLLHYLTPLLQWLVTGSDDKTVRLWEVATGRQFACIETGGIVQTLAWNPNPALHIVAVGCDKKCVPQPPPPFVLAHTPAPFAALVVFTPPLPPPLPFPCVGLDVGAC
jgi:hypothetical protein